MVIARLITNNYVRARRSEILLAGTTTGQIPVWVSKFYLASFIGLVVCGIWSFSIAWWAPAVALVVNMLTGLVPSMMIEANKDAAQGPYKRCASCGTVRPAYYFALDETQPDGHIPNCVACDQPEAWAAVQEMKNEFSDRRSE